MLLPTSIAAMNFEGLFVNLRKIFAMKPPCFFSISMCILLDETKAISIPEKKADNIREQTITRI